MALAATAGGLGPDALYLGGPGSPRVAPDHLVEPGGRERVLAAGCDDDDTKPIELPRLLAKIEALLARAG